MGTTRRQHDVAIVGARAGGGALALLLARMGHDVVVVDRALLPSDTLSTHSLARGGVVQLNRWGLLDEVLASGAPAIRQVAFHTPDGSMTRTVKDRAGVDLLVAPRRPALDTVVTRNAAHHGATLRLGTTVTGLRRDPGTGAVTGLDAVGLDRDEVEIDARVVVGADGLRSFVAREVGAKLAQVRPPTGATYYAYYGGAVWPAIEFFVADQGMAGVFPTHRGEACIWVCVPSDQVIRAGHEPVGSRASEGGRAGARVAAFGALIERISPALAERLRTARRTSLVRGAVGLPNQVRQAQGPGWALVGDALYHRDPITGHGITDAYRDAELLAGALDSYLHGAEALNQALAGYERQTAEARRDIFDITCALGAFPPVDQFVALQRRLSDAIEAEATALAARPTPRPRCLAVA